MKEQAKDETQEIIEELQARADRERAKLMARLNRPCQNLEPGRHQVEMQLVPMACWKCRKPLAAVRSYRFEDVFMPLTELGDTRTVTAFVAHPRKQASGISPVSHR